MALITVIIPMYNKGELIVRAIRSIQFQTFQDFDIIVVDDGSTDNGADIVKKIGDDRIRLIQQKNAGPGAARNTGINATESEYVAFLDADDEWYPWFLENSVKAITEHSVHFVSTYFYKLPHNIDMSKLAEQKGITPGVYDLTGDESPVMANALVACFQPFNSVCRKDIIQKHGGFYDKGRCILGEDQYLFIKMVFSEPVEVISPSAVRYHSESSELASNDKCRPIQPFLLNPDEIIEKCPNEKKHLMLSVLELRALDKACNLLVFGKYKQAVELVSKFPTARQHKCKYKSFMRKLAMGPLYPWYYKIKMYFKTKKLNRQIKPSIPPMPNR